MREKLPFAFAAALIFFFGYRVIVPAHEYMMRPEQIMSLVFDAGMIAGLVATRNRMPSWLFWIALVCGLGLFVIRFTSDAAGWTGQLRYSLLPR
jgi:hypothetical protein